MKKALFLLALCCAAKFADAQLMRSAAYYVGHYGSFSERHKSRLKRYYLGYGIQSMSFDVSARYYVPVADLSNNTTNSFDQTQKFSAASTQSFSSVAGTFFPFAFFGPAKAIGMDLAVTAEAYQFSTPVLNYGNIATMQDDCISEIVSMPIGFVYKSGGEVSLSKHDKVLFTFGAGFAPSMSISKVFVADYNFFIRQYATVEFGLFTGIAWKFRATYFGGNVPLMRTTGGDPTSTVSTAQFQGPIGYMDVATTGSSSFNVSLTILPFSWDWAKDPNKHKWKTHRYYY